MTEQLPLIIILGPLMAAVLAAFAGWLRPKLSHPLVLLGLALAQKIYQQHSTFHEDEILENQRK